MSKPEKIIAMIKEQGMIPLFYHDDQDVCYEVVKALYEGGVRIIEFTNRGEKAIDNFKHVLKKRDKEWPDLLLAIGTIKNVKDAKAFMKAGADFIISPGIVEKVGKTVQESGLLWIPGCMTTTEIMLAESCGAKLVKLFPGNLLGPGFMSAIKELFPGLLFMPTGGVEVERGNLKGWFDAGVCAVGMGSKLITKDILINKQFDKMAQQAKDALAMIKEVRANH
jgi:2-dehydro-3-deoxyphosphogluconate aldolase / (4S)-4-hydroxy-2-oxoglutarate aldolase